MTRSLAQIHCCHWDLGRISGVCGEVLGDLCATGSWRLTRRGCRSRKALQGVIRRKRSGKYKWKCPISLQARKPSFHSIDSTTKGVSFPRTCPQRMRSSHHRWPRRLTGHGVRSVSQRDQPARLPCRGSRRLPCWALIASPGLPGRRCWAASIRPRNRGWGLPGRERNSGWYWQAVKKG